MLAPHAKHLSRSNLLLPKRHPLQPLPMTTTEQATYRWKATTPLFFSAASKNETIDDRYAELSDEAKSYFDEIVKYALSKSDEVKRVKNARYEEYKIRQARLVRLLIKRGVVVCEFVLINDAFRSYLSENKVSVKLAPTVLRVVDEESLQVAKNSIDIAAQTAKEDQERKAQLRREKRKLAREAKKAEEAAAAAAAQAQEEAPAESTEE